jgi:hypothetical protein
MRQFSKTVTLTVSGAAPFAVRDFGAKEGVDLGPI